MQSLLFGKTNFLPKTKRKNEMTKQITTDHGLNVPRRNHIQSIRDLVVRDISAYHAPFYHINNAHREKKKTNLHFIIC